MPPTLPWPLSCLFVFSQVKLNETERNEAERNEAERNEAKRNEAKRSSYLFTPPHEHIPMRLSPIGKYIEGILEK
ncbi:conserved Plasmodium protein, unknown function [Plasmodium ovale wallikeri]|uniref:Uncharacterized protein n=1 Tax=Plasmodium ovale wallikeri TaxID=864142 RepID=A0A1A8YMS2_PLAOA|nr:conserved Plasmodium protein, unknown function [Plasmodium ovale wallikeri]